MSGIQIRTQLRRRLDALSIAFEAAPQAVRVLFSDYEGQSHDELRALRGYAPGTPLVVFDIVDGRRKDSP